MDGWQRLQNELIKARRRIRPIDLAQRAALLKLGLGEREVDAMTRAEAFLWIAYLFKRRLRVKRLHDPERGHWLDLVMLYERGMSVERLRQMARAEATALAAAARSTNEKAVSV